MMKMYKLAAFLFIMITILLFAGCTPMEGSLDEVHKEALNGNFDDGSNGIGIYNIEQLVAIGADETTMARNYILRANITIPENSWKPIGGSGSKGIEFNGIFNGNGHTIDFGNQTIPDTGANYYFGLFNNISGGIVTNLKLTGSITYSGKNNIRAGAVAAQSNGTIRNISSKVSFSTSDVASSATIGGIVGVVTGGIVRDCYSTGAIVVKSISDTDPYIGGIVGNSWNSYTLKYCWSSANLINEAPYWAYTGGIVGRSDAGPSFTLSNCVALQDSIKNNDNSGYPSIGRISGCLFAESGVDVFTSNYAKNNMSINGVNYVLADEGIDKKNGGNINQGNYEDPGWWKDTAWNGANNWGGTENQPWKWSGGTSPRPILWFESSVNR